MDRKLGHGTGAGTSPQERLSLRFTWLAIDDLARLRAFVSKDNPQAARRLSQSLLQSIDHLTRHPHIGHLLDDTSQVRQWVAGSYVVHYRVDADAVAVLRIWHGRERH